MIGFVYMAPRVFVVQHAEDVSAIGIDPAWLTLRAQEILDQLGLTKRPLIRPLIGAARSGLGLSI